MLNKNISEVIKTRRSIRSFSDKVVDESILLECFDSAIWAPSSMNEQPWLYSYAYKGTDVFNKILDVLVPFNQEWAKNASVLIVSMARKNFSKDESTNKYYMYDVGSANQNLLLTAQSHDIYGHVMGGFNSEKTSEVFNLPSDVEPVCVIALGYLGSPDLLREPYKTRETAERKRKPIEEIIIKL